ncbi:MAG: ester cyclase [Treponema sp.]|jgi:predicted ester cyclase|nr:ester cyclase [Treponema sp.]
MGTIYSFILYGLNGKNGSDVIFNWSKQDFINFTILGDGNFGFKKSISLNFHIAEGDKIFTHFTYEGVHDKGNILTYSPTGKKVRFNALYTTRFENGLITEIWATFEGSTILHQLGIVNIVDYLILAPIVFPFIDPTLRFRAALFQD